jgi:hypothetical protein
MRLILRLLVAAGLGADAYIHFDLAHIFSGAQSSGISEGALFQIQAVVAVIAGLLVLVRANRWTYGFAFLVAVSACAAVLLYRYVDVGAIGPIPDMYDPEWYTEKSLGSLAEGVAAVAALLGFLLVSVGSERSVVPGRRQAVSR